MHELQPFVDAFFEALDDTGPTPPDPAETAPTEFTVKNHDDHLVIYHGDEVAAKLSPDSADELLGELALALEKHRADGGQHE